MKLDQGQLLFVPGDIGDGRWDIPGDMGPKGLGHGREVCPACWITRQHGRHRDRRSRQSEQPQGF